MALGLFSYLKDLLEISFFSGSIYYFCLWLKKDKRNNLLLHFFVYCTFFCLAHLFHLPTIAALLIYTCPIAIMLFILFHQELLQRNFITLTHAPIASTEVNEWTEHLLRASLHAMNNNKQVICALEHHAQLQPFLEVPFYCNSPISQNILIHLIESNHYDQNKIIWCTSQGKLIAVNSQWKIKNDETWQSNAVHELCSWKQDALLMTLKTDTIIFNADPKRRSFDAIIKGTLYENLAAHQLLLLLKKFLAVPVSQKGESTHDRTIQKHPTEQPNH